MADGRVTIADVAAEAGVSVATVSKVINDRYGVAEETSANVRKVIERLGYTSSLVAQSLRSRRSNIIGILTADIEAFNAELLKGAARAIRGSGYDLVVFSDCGPRDDQAGWERRSLGRISALTDGTILVTPSSVDVTVSAPLVAVDHNLRSATHGDGRLRQPERRDHGDRVPHRRSATGESDSSPGDPTSSRRSSASRATGGRSRRPASRSTRELVRVGGFQAETARSAARELLVAEERPTAIFAANDVSAIETIAVAADLGLVVPGDLSVVGFDNVPESALCEPPLTTVEQSIQQMGYEAVRMLIGLIDDPSGPPEQVVLPTRLVERSSCRPLAAGS